MKKKCKKGGSKKMDLFDSADLLEMSAAPKMMMMDRFGNSVLIKELMEEWIEPAYYSSFVASTTCQQQQQHGAVIIVGTVLLLSAIIILTKTRTRTQRNRVGHDQVESQRTDILQRISGFFFRRDCSERLDLLGVSVHWLSTGFVEEIRNHFFGRKVGG